MRNLEITTRVTLTLEEIANIEGIKLLDTGILSGNPKMRELRTRINRLAKEYRASNNYLNQCIEDIQKIRKIISNSDFQVVPLTIQEIKRLKNILNVKRRIYSPRAEAKGNCRKYGKRRFQKKIIAIQTLSKEIKSICSKADKRDIFSTLPLNQIDLIERLTFRLLDLRKTIWPYTPSHLSADEELVSVAMTLSPQQPVTIITRDSHLRKLTRIALRSRSIYNQFQGLHPTNPIRVFANYKKGENFSLVYDSINPQLCKKAAQQSYEYGKKLANQKTN